MNSKRTDHPDTRELILRTASNVFARNGYHRTTTAEIAAEAGIDVMELFHFFPSKAEIMNTLLKADLDGAVAIAEALRDASGSPAVRLYRYLVEDVVTLARLPYNLGGATTSGLLRELDFAVAGVRGRRLSAARVAMIRQGIDAGEFTSLDPESAGRAIEWTLEGMLGGEVVDDPDRVGIEIADFCVRALLSDPGRLQNIRDEAMAAIGRD